MTILEILRITQQQTYLIKYFDLKIAHLGDITGYCNCEENFNNRNKKVIGK